VDHEGHQKSHAFMPVQLHHTIECTLEEQIDLPAGRQPVIYKGMANTNDRYI
jgi:hypothetical protein